MPFLILRSLISKSNAKHFFQYQLLLKLCVMFNGIPNPKHCILILIAILSARLQLFSKSKLKLSVFFKCILYESWKEAVAFLSVHLIVCPFFLLMNQDWSQALIDGQINAVSFFGNFAAFYLELTESDRQKVTSPRSYFWLLQISLNLPPQLLLGF